MHRLARGGEMQAARDLVRRSGRTLAQWSHQAEVDLQLATATAEAAASAASP
jgi:hypothetical protein